MQTKNTNTPGEGGFGLSDYYDTQSSKLVQSKNETAAGIALVQVAAVDLKNLKITNSSEMKMCESSISFLFAPMPDRRPASWTPPKLLPEATTPWASFSPWPLPQAQNFIHSTSFLLMFLMATPTNNGEDLLSGPL